MNTIELETPQRTRWDAPGSEGGQALAEYALILAFVSITAVALTPVGQWVATRLADLAAAV
jgi:Flp pilus assembly pilin Flp